MEIHDIMKAGCKFEENCSLALMAIYHSNLLIKLKFYRIVHWPGPNYTGHCTRASAKLAAHESIMKK